MRNYATAQAIGTRSHQCDATAVRTAANGSRAYVLLDGIGSSDAVRDWTRSAARLIAHAAAHRGDAEGGLRAVYEAVQAQRSGADEATCDGLPQAVVVVVVAVPGEPLQFAWCGDSRAYVVSDGVAHKVTDDHNLRRVRPARDGRPSGNRNQITSCLGSSYTTKEVEDWFGHPGIETATRPAATVRLVLASDGAYEPHEDEGRSIADELEGTPRDAARRLVTQAVARSMSTTRALDPSRVHADNATALVADIRP